MTEDAAAEFATLAQALRDRGLDSGKVAYFVNRLVFCMFAEDVELLPAMVVALTQIPRVANKRFWRDLCALSSVATEVVWREEFGH